MTNTFRERSTPLKRWDYFTKSLYQNTARMREFTYHGVIYSKSAELRAIDQKSSNINYVLILILMFMLLFANRYHEIWMVVAYMIIVVAGQTWRYLMLPKDITAHLTDTNRRAY